MQNSDLVTAPAATTDLHQTRSSSPFWLHPLSTADSTTWLCIALLPTDYQTSNERYRIESSIFNNELRYLY